MRRYYISDRRRHKGDTLDSIESAAADGVDWIQIREKDLSPRELLELTRAALARIQRYPARILVNSRLDVALAAGAHGVHLTSDAPSPGSLRPFVPSKFLIGVSTHTLDEAERAGLEFADFAVFGPVFPSASNPDTPDGVGLEALAEVCAWSRLPILALGGISAERIESCVAAGAAGVAGVSMFQGG